MPLFVIMSHVIHILPTLLSCELEGYGPNIVLISSNDVKNYPADSPVVKLSGKELRVQLSLLYDEDRSVAPLTMQHVMDFFLC